MRVFAAVYLALLGACAAGAIAGGLIVFRESGPSDAVEAAADRHGYGIVGWELRHLPLKWLYGLPRLFAGGGSTSEAEALLQHYFELTDEIRRLEAGPSEAGADDRLSAARRERERLENGAEDVLEGRITGLLRQQGLTISPPLFSEMQLLFPPLDFEFDSPPKVLAVSPRDRIHLDRAFLLAQGLGPDRVAAIEREAEKTAGTSAVVLDIGAVATYPSTVPELDSYEAVVENVIHEWLHQYLALFPLGRSYFDSDETRTLNETVASMAAGELAEGFLERYPSPLPARPSPETAPGFDFRGEMRALRRKVGELLEEKRVEEAERLMEVKRREFEREGFYIRRINQAYFAFQGSYADSPASIDPIGPKLQRLRRRAGSVEEFVRLASRLTSEEELDRLLAEGSILSP